MDHTAFIEQFRAAFPEFSDTDKYSDATVEFWLNMSLGLVNETRWGSLYQQGLMFVLAHHLALAVGNAAAGARGGSLGSIPSRVASKSVDKVSVSYDTSSGTLEGAGMWGLTTYGMQFYQLSLLIGAGGYQL